MANRPDQCADWSRGVPGGGQGCLRGPDGGSSMERRGAQDEDGVKGQLMRLSAHLDMIMGTGRNPSSL